MVTHACGRKDFHSLRQQITKDTYIYSLHFVEPIDENSDSMLATSLTERTVKREPLNTPKIKRICTENIVEDVVDFEREGSTLQITEDVEDLQTQHKGTQTLSLEKSILASQIETKIHQYQMLENRTAPTKNKPKNSKYNPMAFEAINRDRKKCKFIIIS